MLEIVSEECKRKKKKKRLQGRGGIKPSLLAVSWLKSFIRFTGVQRQCSEQRRRSSSRVSQRPGWRHVPALFSMTVNVKSSQQMFKSGVGCIFATCQMWRTAFLAEQSCTKSCSQNKGGGWWKILIEMQKGQISVCALSGLYATTHLDFLHSPMMKQVSQFALTCEEAPRSRRRNKFKKKEVVVQTLRNLSGGIEAH